MRSGSLDRAPPRHPTDVGFRLVQQSPAESRLMNAAMAKHQEEEAALRSSLKSAGFELVEQLVSTFEEASPRINNFYVLKKEADGRLYVVKVGYAPIVTYRGKKPIITCLGPTSVIGRITQRGLQNYLAGRSPQYITDKECRPGDKSRKDGVRPVSDELCATLEQQLSTVFRN